MLLFHFKHLSSNSIISLEDIRLVEKTVGPNLKDDDTGGEDYSALYAIKFTYTDGKEITLFNEELEFQKIIDATLEKVVKLLGSPIQTKKPRQHT